MLETWGWTASIKHSNPTSYPPIHQLWRGHHSGTFGPLTIPKLCSCISPHRHLSLNPFCWLLLVTFPVLSSMNLGFCMFLIGSPWFSYALLTKSSLNHGMDLWHHEAAASARAVAASPGWWAQSRSKRQLKEVENHDMFHEISRVYVV